MKTLLELAAPMYSDAAHRGEIKFSGTPEQISFQYLLALRSLKESLSSIPSFDYSEPLVDGGSPSDHELRYIAIIDTIRLLELTAIEAFENRTPTEITVWATVRIPLNRTTSDEGTLIPRPYTAREAVSHLFDLGIKRSADKIQKEAADLDFLLAERLISRGLVVA